MEQQSLHNCESQKNKAKINLLLHVLVGRKGVINKLNVVVLLQPWFNHHHEQAVANLKKMLCFGRNVKTAKVNLFNIPPILIYKIK